MQGAKDLAEFYIDFMKVQDEHTPQDIMPTSWLRLPRLAVEYHNKAATLTCAARLDHKEPQQASHPHYCMHIHII